MSPLAHVVALPIRLYRLVGSPWVGRNCRFQPTCSEYALEALTRHGAFRGTLLTLRRLSRCRPGGGDGYDPVPPAGTASGSEGDDESRRGTRPGG